MAKYRVWVKEVHGYLVEVDADDSAEAREKANEYIQENEINTEYSHTMELEDWDVYMVTGA